MNRASATLGNAAPVLRSGETEHIAQHPQQRHVVWCIDPMLLPVYRQHLHGFALRSRANSPLALPLPVLGRGRSLCAPPLSIAVRASRDRSSKASSFAVKDAPTDAGA